MKFLAITGLHNDNLNSLFSHIHTDEKDTVVQFNKEINQFHRQVFESFDIDLDGFSKPQTLQVGEMRVQQAAQIFLSYSKSRLLCWSNPLTVSMFGFWKKIEPQTKFLLLYQPPWVAINNLFRQFPEKFEQNPETAAMLWKSYNKRMLQFYNNNKENCIMINSSFMAESFGQLNTMMKDKFGVELLVDSGEQISKHDIQPDNNLTYLLVQNDPELLDFYMQIESQADLLGREPDMFWQEELQKLPVKKEVLASWFKTSVVEVQEKELSFSLASVKNLLQQKSEMQDALQVQLGGLIKEKEGFQLEIDKYNQKINDMTNDLEQQKIRSKELVDELKQNNDKLTQDVDKAKKEADDLRQSIQEHQQEEEQSLLQLHQVQEELEGYFLKNKEQVSEINSLKKRITDYQNNSESLNKKIKEAQENNSYLEMDIKNIQQKLGHEVETNKKLKVQINQNEETLKNRDNQLNQTQSQLTDVEKNQVKLSKEQVEQLSQQNKQLTDEKNKQAKLAKDRQQQIEKLKTNINSLNAELKNNKQEIENYRQEEELSLLQLHQVQEELEYYFLLQQDTQKLLDGYADKMQDAQKLIVGYARQSMEKH